MPRPRDLIAGGIAWIVHLARPMVGTMFDNDNVGPTVVFGAVALIIIIIGIFLTRSSMRVVAVEGPCPCCGISSVRRFDKPTDPSSDPTPCGACIAYLRTSGTTLREEALETTQRSGERAPGRGLP